MKNYFFFLFAFLSSVLCAAQNAKKSTNKGELIRPKLVVGIVIDQMRYDYLTRFYSRYGTGGFKRMIKEGFNCKNNHFNYVPTYTGPGHASIFTGTTPKYHGIIANNWYDKKSKKMVYCAEDNSVLAVGSNSKLEQMSPHRMKTTTFADENRLFTQMRGKTIGMSIKDRGAVLSAGHTANAAYWFRGKDEGNFITSTYYMNKMPQWVKKFNASRHVESYLKAWNTLYDISTYKESGDDFNSFEGGFQGKKTATFPYNLKKLKDKNGGFDILKNSPYGNSILTDFAILAIREEQLGKDSNTDVLTISFSSTDYIGHNFGVNSKEIEDAYLRLDKDLERLFKVLDTEVGDGEYTVFLTADHGAINVPSYLKSIKIPSGYFNYEKMKKKLCAKMLFNYKSDSLIENMSNNQIFLNRDKILQLNLDINDIQKDLVNEIINYNNVDKVYSATTMATNYFSEGIENLLQNGYNQKRSGDVLIVKKPAYISYGKTGSTHGSGLNYDTHVPLLFFGKGITHGQTLKKTVITDIAPTMAALLGISFSSASIGKPLEFILNDEK